MSETTGLQFVLLVPTLVPSKFQGRQLPHWEATLKDTSTPPHPVDPRKCLEKHLAESLGAIWGMGFPGLLRWTSPFVDKICCKDL